FCFFFSSRRRHTRFSRDWSSDVCSSDLGNIVEDTFGIEYKFVEHDSPDHIIVEIINEDTWQPDEVKCVLPGGTELRPYRTQFPRSEERRVGKEWRTRWAR